MMRLIEYFLVFIMLVFIGSVLVGLLGIAFRYNDLHTYIFELSDLLILLFLPLYDIGVMYDAVWKYNWERGK